MSAPRLLDQVRQTARLRHLSLRTERAYTGWVYRFVVFNGKRHPSSMGAVEVRRFLSHLATAGRVSASTQNQALCALLFLYRDVLEVELGRIDEVVRARRTRRIPVVLSREEVRSVLAHLTGTHALIAGLLYGGGLRLMEALRLRVKDLDFERNAVVVRQGKGDKDRVVMLPGTLKERLREHLASVRALHERDLRSGFGAVELPNALARKKPGAERSWAWSTSSHPGACQMTHAPAAAGATIFPNLPSRRRSLGQSDWPGYRRRPVAIRFGTRSPPTCWQMGTTSAQCRSCSGMPTYVPP